MNPLCLICPHRYDEKHSCHLLEPFRRLWRRIHRRNSLDRFQLAIQEVFVDRYVNHTADLIASMFWQRRAYGAEVLRKALSKLEGAE